MFVPAVFRIYVFPGCSRTITKASTQTSLSWFLCRSNDLLKAGGQTPLPLTQLYQTFSKIHYLFLCCIRIRWSSFMSVSPPVLVLLSLLPPGNCIIYTIAFTWNWGFMTIFKYNESDLCYASRQLNWHELWLCLCFETVRKLKHFLCKMIFLLS